MFAKTDSTNSDSTTGSKLVVNYQMSTDINSVNSNAITGSEVGVHYQISTKTN